MKDLPHNIEMEKELLSAMMFKGGVAVPQIVSLLSAADFYRPEHQIIFKALAGVYEEHQQANLLLLIEYLKQAGELKRLSLPYLYSLSAIAHTAAYAEDYANTIKDKAKLREIISWGDSIMEKAYTETATAEELLASLDTFLAAVKNDKPATFRAAGEITGAVCERTTQLSKHKGLTGVTTGLLDLDKITNGLQKAELILLAARPSMGKTALALNIAASAAQANHVVALFSLEMSCQQLGARLLSTLSGVDCTKINAGNVDSNDIADLYTALENLENLPLYIDDTSGLTIADIRSKLRQLQHDKGLGLIVVDYLQLMRGKAENRVQEVSEVSRGLKSLAKEFNVPVLALSQLSRNVEMRADKKPQLADLRDSGSLEQDADIVMFLYRDEYYNNDGDDSQNTAELIIAKNRNGATNSVHLYFDKSTTRFGNLTREFF